MKTFCIVDRIAIPEKRQRLGCNTCSAECQEKLRRGRRNERAKFRCRLCGRRLLTAGQIREIAASVGLKEGLVRRTISLAKKTA